MKYTLVWPPSALNRLAELWNEGPDRAEISEASNQMDQSLARDPHNQGEAREGFTRILIHHPLAINFSVSEVDCLVTVFAVWGWKAP